MGFPKIRPFAASPLTAYIWTLAVSLLLIVSGSTVKSAISSFVIKTAYAPFYSANNGFKKIFAVYRDNRILLSRVVELTAENARLSEVRRENARLRGMLGFKLKNELAVIPGEVVGSPSVPVRGKVWISTGSTVILETGSPVVTPDGLVGDISEYAGDLAVVRSLWDRDCRVAAIDRRSRAPGLVQWVSGPYLAFNYVQDDDDVAVGDTIVTSGWGERYPEGLPIGEVKSVAVDSAAFFLSVTVKPFVRFETLEEVFILLPGPDQGTETEQ